LLFDGIVAIDISFIIEIWPTGHELHVASSLSRLKTTQLGVAISLRTFYILMKMVNKQAALNR
jgi:hypothetical protein